MAALLGGTIKDSLLQSERIGKLIETFVYTQLVAQMESFEARYHLYHYRDHAKREIDFLLEGPNDLLVGIEVKSGTVTQRDDFKHLRWFKDNLAKGRPFIAIVISKF